MSLTHPLNTPNQHTLSMQVYDACRGIYRFRSELSQFLVMHLIVDLLSNARSLKEYKDHLNNIATEICHVLEGTRRYPATSAASSSSAIANVAGESTALDQAPLSSKSQLGGGTTSGGVTTAVASTFIPPARGRGHEQVGVPPCGVTSSVNFSLTHLITYIFSTTTRPPDELMIYVYSVPHHRTL